MFLLLIEASLVADMEKVGNSQRSSCSKATEPEFLLQWGTRKKIRCVRFRDSRVISQRSDVGVGLLRRRVTTSEIGIFSVPSFASEKQNSHHLQSNSLKRNSEVATLRSSENRKSSSPPEEERYYATRGSAGGIDENGKVSGDGNLGEDKKLAWPKICITLSSKEKEEDFMAMKGCKPPHRPKKRAKIIQRSLLLVSPGAWLTDMCQERYEVKEKKSTKKRPRGLKAMGSAMDSDSD